MKKVIMTLCFIALSVVFVYGYADAVSGQCSNCHTMHNSQDNSAMALEYDGVTPLAAQEQLLTSNCIGCHTSTVDGDKLSSVGGPAVLHTPNPVTQGGTQTLAGGDFYWVNADEATDAAKGHNVIDLPGVTVADTNIGITPPGWDAAATSGNTFDSKSNAVTNGVGTWGANQLTCAGTYGCHGTRDLPGFGGLSGAHHGNTGAVITATAALSASPPTTIGSSFRFLAGIVGKENADWNYGETTSSHNEYFGEDNTADRSAGVYAGNEGTISFLCAQCHGLFHATIDADATSGNPWVRHPTDIALPNSGEYVNYNSDDGVANGQGAYNLTVPLARPVILDSMSATVDLAAVDETGGVVMCLSCHRAHGSPEPDMLRWTYSTMTIGSTSTSGCFTCHTGKNNTP